GLNEHRPHDGQGHPRHGFAGLALRPHLGRAEEGFGRTVAGRLEPSGRVLPGGKAMQAISTVPAKSRARAPKYRVISAAAALSLAAGALALLAAPPSPAAAPPVVGCTTGSSCMVELNYQVTYTGSSGGANGVVITPPPCIGIPIGDAHTGSQAIISLYSNTAPVAQPSSASPTATAGGAAPSSTDSAGPTASVSPTVPASSTVSPGS